MEYLITFATESGSISPIWFKFAKYLTCVVEKDKVDGKAYTTCAFPQINLN